MRQQSINDYYPTEFQIIESIYTKKMSIGSDVFKFHR